MVGIEWKISSHSFSPAHLTPPLSLYKSPKSSTDIWYMFKLICIFRLICVFFPPSQPFSFYTTVTIYYMMHNSASWFFTLKVFKTFALNTIVYCVYLNDHMGMSYITVFFKMMVWVCHISVISDSLLQCSSNSLCISDIYISVE